MGSNTAIASPFTANILAGWEPVHPHIRYPVTVGLHREGENYALFVAPMDLNLLHSLLPISAADQALVMTSGHISADASFVKPGQVHKMPWAAISDLGDDVDIIHLPEHAKVGTSDIQTLAPILMDPESAVPEAWGSQLAIGFHDGCHATIVTPNADIIRSVLVGFMSAYVQSVMGLQSRFPDVPTALQDALLAPMLPGEWTEIRFQPHQRYWVIEFAHQGDPASATQWVASANHGYWRSGWSW